MKPINWDEKNWKNKENGDFIFDLSNITEKTFDITAQKWSLVIANSGRGVEKNQLRNFYDKVLELFEKAQNVTDKEFEVMKAHSEIGHEMLKHSRRSIFEVASIVAYEHHEKYDGTGYPQGLKAQEIDINGRITAIADVFDALGSDRIYKKAWQDEKIFALLKEQKGKHFDPTLIDIFFDNLDEFLKIRDTYVD